MKTTNLLLIFIFTFFISTAVSAQVSTEKKTGTDNNKTEQKSSVDATTNAKAKSDTAMTSGTPVKTNKMPREQKSQARSKQNASGNTIIELHPNGEKTSKQKDPFKASGKSGKSSSIKKPTMEMGTKLGAAGAAAKIMDAEGNLMYSMDPDGTVRNVKGSTVGMYYGNGEFYTAKGDKSASVNPYGLIRNKNGEDIGRISKYGTVVDKSGVIMGYIYKDGSILDAKKQKIGTATGIDVQLAALIFFTKQGKQ